MTRPEGPPGRETQDGSPGRHAPPESRRHLTSPPPSAEVTSTVAAGADSGRSLAYDQIDPARLVAGDATGRLDGHLGVLGVALAQWMARSDDRGDAPARRAASTAIDSVDAMLGELYELRGRLISEVQQADRLTAERADALLGRGRRPS